MTAYHYLDTCVSSPVEEVPPNIYCISSATENIIIEVSSKIWKNICFVTIAYKEIIWKYI